MVTMTCYGESVLVEAESFDNHGGWKLDTQFIQIMGSSYLLAHGLGKPVQDATTKITFPAIGQYRVWVRTKDWVARWNAEGQPGRFQLFINSEPCVETFGTKGAEWFWQNGGIVDIKDRNVMLALHDLTGFDGRCDAIYFSTDLDKSPPSDGAVLPEWRRDLLGLPEKPKSEGPYDLVVVGGGYAGTCSAISAARMGCRVALIQDRPVLGGNGSQEIRVSAHLRPWLMKIGKYPHLGEIVEELIDHTRHTQPKGTFEEADDRRLNVVKAEKNIDLFLNHHAYAVEKENKSITAVLALDTRTNARRKFTGHLFADCTGHGTIGALAGADYDMSIKGHSGTTNKWVWRRLDGPQVFPDTPWALDLEMSDFPYPDGGGGWNWQTGFDKHPINELEYIRDWNLRAIFGAWNAMKNKSGADEHRNAVLEWVAFIAGPRESRRLMGDIVLTEQHINTNYEFSDGLVPAAWFIDLHGPDKRYENSYPNDPFIGHGLRERDYVKPPYYVPYRCLYSRNVENLFMAGRDISVTYEAHGLIRVMQTGGMMG